MLLSLSGQLLKQPAHSGQLSTGLFTTALYHKYLCFLAGWLAYDRRVQSFLQNLTRKTKQNIKSWWG